MSNHGATFTYQQKLAAYQAFTRGWRRAYEDKPAWSKMSPEQKVEFIRAKIQEEIFNLPEKQPVWRRVLRCLTKKPA